MEPADEVSDLVGSGDYSSEFDAVLAECGALADSCSRLAWPLCRFGEDDDLAGRGAGFQFGMGLPNFIELVDAVQGKTASPMATASRKACSTFAGRSVASPV
jgi:hypothetical protein